VHKLVQIKLLTDLFK